jgi:hypothetical protein
LFRSFINVVKEKEEESVDCAVSSVNINSKSLQIHSHRFLNNIADTNEPTNAAVKLHLALFDDGKKINLKALESAQPFSISRNLVQRKHDSNNMEMNRGFAANANSADNKGEIDAISTASRSGVKLNDFVTSTNRKTIAEQRRSDSGSNSSRAQSFLQFFKLPLECCSSRKINEQTELNYPLNLHLRMNEIFSVHDKLCDIAEYFNDLYSIGKSC